MSSLGSDKKRTVGHEDDDLLPYEHANESANEVREPDPQSIREKQLADDEQLSDDELPDVAHGTALDKLVARLSQNSNLGGVEPTGGVEDTDLG